MTEELKRTIENAGRYRTKYKNRMFYGKTKKEALAARNEYIMQEGSDAEIFITRRLNEGMLVNQIHWPAKKIRTTQ